MTKHKIDLCVGDWSGDGHEKSEIITISSNLSEKENKWETSSSDEELEEEIDEDEIQIHEPYQFAFMWMFIAKLGNPDLEYIYVENHSEVISIGGYGLFG